MCPSLHDRVQRSGFSSRCARARDAVVAPYRSGRGDTGAAAAIAWRRLSTRARPNLRPSTGAVSSSPPTRPRRPLRCATRPPRCATMVGMSRLARALRERILVLDGAMGTMIQAAELTASDFGGEHYEGCNEYLNLTRPDVIRGIHAAYVDAGADVVSTNTFGCAPYVLGEYGLADRAHELCVAAARLAREAAGDRFVVGAMGPSTRSISVTRNVTFDDVMHAYAVQAPGPLRGGVDALLLETAQDTLNLKAAALGVRAAQHAAGRGDGPLRVSRNLAS